MVRGRLREVMLAAVGAGDLEGDDVCRGSSSHPVCGDHVEISLRMQGDDVIDLRWRAAGCPATMAVTALAAGALPGHAIDECPAILAKAIADHDGLARHERHAEALVLRALTAAHENR
ncbi:MAG: iron-sulfur cluster assembly scaffold protein [bacterium]|nr:iron-sulfur cluster assembly scaffold protein [bacterium]